MNKDLRTALRLLLSLAALAAYFGIGYASMLGIVHASIWLIGDSPLVRALAAPVGLVIGFFCVPLVLLNAYAWHERRRKEARRG